MNVRLEPFDGSEIGINIEMQRPTKVSKAMLVSVEADHIVVLDPKHQGVRHYVPWRSISRLSMEEEGLPVGSLFHRETVRIVVHVGYAIELVPA